MSLRFFNVYGAGQNPEYAGVITKFANRLDAGNPPEIYGSGEQTRDFVSVTDIVRAIKLSLEKGASGTCNVGTGRSISVNELARIMLDIYGSQSTPTHHQRIEGDILESCADISKAKRMLGYEPTADLYQGLQKMLRPKAAGIVVSAES
jgi:UDP-glucose 4-epimerase